MQQRRITLDDGRYLIFYTFEDEGEQGARESGEGEAESAKESPDAEPQAEEERRV